MSVKHLILGVLMEKPFYGYQLKSEAFKKIFGDFGINDGQLYPTLNKLEQEELLIKTVELQLGAPSRHIYSITEKGREELLLWLAASEGKQNAFRYDFFRKDPFLIRCNFIRYLEKPAAVNVINQQMDAVRIGIAELNIARDNMIKKGIESVRISILEYGIKIQETRLEWLESFMKVIEEDS